MARVRMGAARQATRASPTVKLTRWWISQAGWPKPSGFCIFFNLVGGMFRADSDLTCPGKSEASKARAMTNLLTVRLCASLLALVVFVAPSLAGDVLPVLKTRTETFANVTLINRTATHAFVQHSRGVANIKLVD